MRGKPPPGIDHCPFCDRNPHDPMHYITGRQIFQNHNVVTVLMSFTCVYSMPEERPESPSELWAMPGTFLIHAQTIEKKSAHEGEAEMLRGIRLDPDERKRFDTLGEGLEDD